MATKTITVTEESYGILKSVKKDGESFSELVKRTFTPKGDIMAYAGILTEKEGDEIKSAIKELRESSVKRIRERAK